MSALDTLRSIAGQIRGAAVVGKTDVVVSLADELCKEVEKPDASRPALDALRLARPYIVDARNHAANCARLSRIGPHSGAYQHALEEAEAALAAVDAAIAAETGEARHG